MENYKRSPRIGKRHSYSRASSCSPNRLIKPRKISSKDLIQKAPTFMRLIRANTKINTNFTVFEEFQEKDLPDLQALKEKNKDIQNILPEDDRAILLRSYIKVREATQYELIDEAQLLKSSDFLKAVFTIKAAISELSLLISNNSIFELLIILVILSNTLTIALDSIYSIPHYLEQVFLYIYTGETMLKIFAKGFIFNSDAYLRDKWNIMDFIIVLTGWIEMIQYKLNILRVLRIIRPLRNISSIKGFRVIFMALVQAARPFGGTLASLCFFIYIFAIAGIQTMMGSFRFRCMDLNTGVYDSTSLCGNHDCPMNWVCVESLFNPNLDNTSFDNIFSSLIIVFECVTLQTWVPLMNIAEKTVNAFVILYYLPLSFVGAFLILNLSLAVIKSAFTKSMEKVRELKLNPDLQEQVLNTSFESEMEEIKIDETVIHENVWDKLGEIDEQSTFREGRRGRRSSSLTFKTASGKLFSELFPEDFKLREFAKPQERFMRQKSITLVPSKAKKPFNQRDVIEMELEKNSFIKRDKKRKKSLKELTKKISSILDKGIRTDLSTFRAQKTENYNRFNSEVSIKYLNKLKNSISIRTDILKKIKRNKEIGQIKIYITETHTIISESHEDVKVKEFNADKLKNAGSTFYEFKYKGANDKNEDELEEKWRTENEYFLSKLPASTNQMKTYNLLSLKCGNSTAFYLLMGSSKFKVKCIRENDELSGKIEGHWSGIDVLPEEDERNTLFTSRLSYLTYIIWQRGIKGKLHKVQFVAKEIENSKYTVIGMITAVVLNALILSVEYYGMDPLMEKVIENINLAFNIIFITELGIRVLALGIIEFSRDSMNYIDTFVIILSFLEVAASIGSSALNAFRVIRIFRIFRIYRFARRLVFMKSLVFVITHSLPKFIYLALLLALLNLVYSLLGYQIFAGKLDFRPEEIRGNFDNFGWAYLTVFQILTLSSYSEILYIIMKSSAGQWSALYLIIWIIIGNFVLLNLFIAILLDSFIQESQESENMTEAERILSLSKATLFTFNRSKTLKKKESEKMRILQDFNRSLSQKSLSLTLASKQETILLFTDTCSRSYFIFAQDNPLRVVAYKIFVSKAFGVAMFVIIFLNCLVLVWETYTLNFSSQDMRVRLAHAFEIAFTVIYLCEFLIKTIAIGVFHEENTYFKDYWNILDFSILVISCLDSFTSFINFTSIRALRVIRAIRPLRFLSRNSSMKLLVSALMSSLGAITNVICVLIIVWFVFAVLGVSLFSGKLYHCEHELFHTQESCESSGFAWINAHTNFDNIFEAFVSLFVVGMLEGWQEVMYLCIDATDKKTGPSHNNNITAGYYFLFFIFIGSFFFLHLFTGVVFMRYHQVKQEESSIYSLLLTKRQQCWVEIQKMIIQCTPNHVNAPPTGTVRKMLYFIVTNNLFEFFMSMVILFNMIAMSMVYNKASSDYINALELVNMVCAGIFTFEVLLKLNVFGVRSYFQSRWNTFDFFVVICAMIDIIIDSQLSLATRLLRTGPQMLRIFRVFRISRLIRIFKPLKFIRNLIAIVLYSLPPIVNVISLLALFIFIYSIIGVFLFSGVDEGRYIDSLNNFKNFTNASIILIRISTGGDWPGIMFDCAKLAGKPTAAAYFFSFIFVTVLLILNLFIMVIIQNYEDFESNPNSSLSVFTKQLRKFNKAWDEYSVVYNGWFIKYHDLVSLLKSLSSDIGVIGKSTYLDSIEEASRMNLKIDGKGRIGYHDLLYNLLKKAYGSQLEVENDKVSMILLKKQEKETLKGIEEIAKKAKKRSIGKYRVDEEGVQVRSMFLYMVYARRAFLGLKMQVNKSKAVPIVSDNEN